MNQFSRCYLFLLLIVPTVSQAQDFPFTDKEKPLQIVYSKKGPKLDSIAAYLLANDIKMATNNQAQVVTEGTPLKGNVIVIGNIASPLVKPYYNATTAAYKNVKGQWERYAWKVIDKPTPGISKLLVIAGSDARGTAYGVFSLSEKLGVSPWYWWADAPVTQQKNLTLTLKEQVSNSPRIKFRGLFINDEDWGLQPWAAKTFEPETGDIGPKTYAKVFELILRLKGNLIWPAMHPCTKAFFSIAGNKKVAEDYSIVIGTSHAEPMMRNNVGEWDEKTMGHFNYVTNKEKVTNYWESRVKETTANDVLYTMGMRGVHDSGMEGVKNKNEAVPLLEQIIKDQRALLSKYQGKPADSIPQVFTAYKEVLEIYDNGLKVPDDITLVWPDDNYGFISRLNNDAERKRSGGSGVYYHASYWGRPHDYLWIGSTDPSLMKEELMKALYMGADKLWVLNVGDIKPLEYNTNFFFSLAYDPTAPVYLEDFIKRTISQDPIALGYTRYALSRSFSAMYERKPEFMGWSRTEPTTQTTYTAYNHFFNGDEARGRLHEYEMQERDIRISRAMLAGKPGEAAFYQLAYYPVMCAAWMNYKFLYRERAIYYAKQNRLSAYDHAAMSKAAYDSIVKETEYYNNTLSGGKWKNMMSMKPRDLPVFKEPVFPEFTIDASEGWSVAPEGFVTKDSSLIGAAGKLQLPVFYSTSRREYIVDVFLCDTTAVDWTVTGNDWIKFFRSSGSLSNAFGKKEQRTRVSIDWSKAPADKAFSGKIIFKGGGKQIEVFVHARRLAYPNISDMTDLELDGLVTIDASRYAAIGDSTGTFKWKRDISMGYSGRLLNASLPKPGDKAMKGDLATIKKEAQYAEYHFYNFTPAAPIMTVFSVPTHPVNNNFSNRYAVAVDDGPLTLVDFKTEGRSEEWKQNVLSNRAKRDIQLQYLDKGLHKLRIYCVDPGVMLEEIQIKLAGWKQIYSGLEEIK